MYVQYVLVLFFLQILQFTDESHESHNSRPRLPQLVSIQHDVGSSIQLQCNMSYVQSKHLVWWFNDVKTVYNGPDGTLDERFNVLIKPDMHILIINTATANYDGLYRADTVDGVVLVRYHLVVHSPISSPHPTTSVPSSTSTTQPSQQQQQDGSSNQSTVPTYAIYYVCAVSTVGTAIVTYFLVEHMRKKYRDHITVQRTEEQTLLEKLKSGRSVAGTTISQPVDIDGTMEPDNEMSLHGGEQTGVIAER